MRPLFTIFDLLQLMGPVLGTAAGCAGGYCLFGTVGLVVGGILGLFIGKFLGNLSGNMSILAVHRQFTGKSDDVLRAELHRPECEYPNFILLELNYRGADVSSELPVVLDMLESPDRALRQKGVAAITSAFPDMARKLPDYRPSEPVDECRKKVRVVRDQDIPRFFPNADEH